MQTGRTGRALRPALSEGRPAAEAAPAPATRPPGGGLKDCGSSTSCLFICCVLIVCLCYLLLVWLFCLGCICRVEKIAARLFYLGCICRVERPWTRTAILQNKSSQTKIIRVEIPGVLPVFWGDFTPSR